MMQYLCGLFALNSFLLCRFMCSRLLCLCQHFRIIQNDLNPRKERIFAQLYFRYKFISKVILKVIQGFLVNRFDLERAVSKSATNGMEEFCHKLGANEIDNAAESLLSVQMEIAQNKGKPPKTLCVICGLSNAAYQRSDGVFVVPITALKN